MGRKAMTTAEFEAQVKAAVNTVYDPCSVAAGRPVGLVDLGLLIDYSLTNHCLHLRFRATFTGCTMAPHFMEAARAAVLSLPGVAIVTSELVSDALWTPDMAGGLTPPPPARVAPQAWRLRQSA
jgi:metal-sulfur cluster biosynthetic enzyme